MNETQAREEICRVGRNLFERGYVHATAGNISSARTPYRNLHRRTAPNLLRTLVKNYA